MCVPKLPPKIVPIVNVSFKYFSCWNDYQSILPAVLLYVAIACEVGYYWVNRLNCSSCPAHSTVAAGASSIAQCVCSPGYYGTNGGTCNICPVKSYCVGGTTATLCPDETTSIEGSISSSNCTTVNGAVTSVSLSSLFWGMIILAVPLLIAVSFA
jgi:hypothetical protein